MENVHLLWLAVIAPFTVELLRNSAEHLIDRATGSLEIRIDHLAAYLDIVTLPRGFPPGFSLVFAAFGIDLGLAFVPELLPHPVAAGVIPKGVAVAIGGLVLVCIILWLARLRVETSWPSLPGRLTSRIATASSGDVLVLDPLTRWEWGKVSFTSIIGSLAASASVALPMWALFS